MLFAVLLAAADAQAQLYRWVDPESGSVKLSNAPPPWYRDERPGPAVQVILPPRMQSAKPEALPKPPAKPAAALPDPDGPSREPPARPAGKPQ